jgi:site-specific DNA-cytosine methylase
LCGKSKTDGEVLNMTRNILIACEFSGIVREAFRKKGWNAWSCDLLETEIPGQHIRGDVRDYIGANPYNDYGHWDMLIAHPPCTHLAVSGARWFKNKVKEQEEALEFVRYLLHRPIKSICIENPVSIISTKIRKPDQIIQPWMFGHGETKATCLWLVGLPKLKPTRIVKGRKGRIWNEPPGINRWKNRSRTYKGIAKAMAEQWGEFE